MRNRTIGINVRVSESEKKKLKRNAKKSGLNLSAYLRKCGLQQEIYAIPDENIYKIYTGIVELKNEFPALSEFGHYSNHYFAASRSAGHIPHEAPSTRDVFPAPRSARGRSR